jgi:hypothetical protein
MDFHPIYDNEGFFFNILYKIYHFEIKGITIKSQF